MALPPWTTLDISLTTIPGAPGVNPYSARALKGTLQPINAARGEDKVRRTVNGTLISIAAPQMQKYRLEIRGNDQAPPALDGLWVGMTLLVNGMVEIGYQTAAGPPATSRLPAYSRIEGDYTYYQMQLTMMVIDLQVEREEWAAVVPWMITLEEV